MRALLLLAVLLVSTGIHALTEADAVRIGREKDIRGLRTLIAERAQGLLHRAMNSWPKLRETREYPPALEALAIEFYADPVAQRPLIGQLGNNIAGAERYPRYRSRKLFELMYADLKAGRETHHYAIRIISTDLSLEAELMPLLPGLSPEAANEIVMYLGARKYAPAVPALVALQARVPHERNVNGVLDRVDWAFLQIGTPEAIQALLARVRALGGMRSEAAGHEIGAILMHFQQRPPGGAPSFVELSAALPAELSDSASSTLIRMIAERRNKADLPQVLRVIALSPRPGEAVDVLLALGDAADWRAGREALEQSRISGQSKTPLLQKVDQALADPARFLAQREERERSQALQRAQEAAGRESHRIAAYRKSDPKRYAAEMAKLLQTEESRLSGLPHVPAMLGHRQSLAREYTLLGSFQRFTLRQSDEALASYAAASRVAPSDSFDIAAVGAADLERFDKRNSRKALEHYRRALAGAPPDPSRRDASFFRGVKRWIDLEIAYLERGRRFTGEIGPDDVQLAYLWLGLMSMQHPIDPPPDAATLARLPTSQFQIGRAFTGLIELAPGEMLPFFERHDPAGYISAAVLAFAMYKEPSPYLKAAAATYFRRHGIQMGGKYGKEER